MDELSELPESWNVCNLKDVCTLINGDRGKNYPSKDKLSSEGYPFVNAGHINSGRIAIEGMSFVDEKRYGLLRSGKFTVGDIIFCIRGSLGKVALNRNIEEGAIASSLIIVRPNQLVDSSFVYYYLSSPLSASMIKKYDNGSAQPNLSGADLARFRLPLPPISKQKIIVSKIETLFSELDKGIESLKTARQQLKAYRQAVLKHAFEGKLTEQWRQQNYEKLETPEQLLARIQQKRVQRYQQQLEEWKQAVKVWEENGKEEKKPGKPSAYKSLPAIEHEELEKLPSLPESWVYVRLTEIATIGSGMSVSKSRKLADPMEVPYLRVANVQRGALVLDEIKTMPVERLSLPALELQKWDILFNEGGDRDKLGRGWVWEKQIEPCITQNHVFRATPYMSDEFHSKFISHWGNTFGRFYFEKSGKQTTNLASINKAVLSKFPVPMPSMEEQRKIIEALDDATSLIDSLENEIEMGLARSETLRQSILKKAFSGQLLQGESVLKNINSSSLVDSVI